MPSSPNRSGDHRCDAGRDAARALIAAALAAADPVRAVREGLATPEVSAALGATAGRLVVVGAGKAAAAMARAAEQTLGERIAAGLVIAPRGGPAGPVPQRIEVVGAAHPIPDAEGLAAAQRMLGLVQGLGADDLVLCLVSGGASALATLPRPPLTLGEVQLLNAALLSGGVPIAAINAVRKHTDLLKGGQLAAAAAPARVVALILSDVVGNPLSTIASGPTVADETTFADALAVLDQIQPEGELASVRELLRAGAAGQLAETPKPGDARLAAVTNRLVGSNATAAEAALRRAGELGFDALLLTTCLEGEARAAGRVLGAVLREMATCERPVRRPGCLVIGGETTVRVRGAGRGGRNQELALAAAPVIDGLQRALLVTLATDGVDGPTDAAGALVDGSTAQRARARGLSIARHLAENDAYPLLDALGDLLRTGPTGTNVNDLCFLLTW